MIEDLQLRQELDRASRAQALLNDELLREAIDTLRARISDDLFSSPVRDSEGRERLWLMHRLLASVEGHLKTLVETGKMANLQLERKRSLKDKARELLAW